MVSNKNVLKCKLKKKGPSKQKTRNIRPIWTQNGGEWGKKARFLSLKIRVKHL